MGDGDGVDLVPIEVGVMERLVDDGKNSFDVGAGGDFGDDATVGLVEIDLGNDDVAKNLRAVFDDGGGGFVATGFDT